jgi:hypothetical protein
LSTTAASRSPAPAAVFAGGAARLGGLVSGGYCVAVLLILVSLLDYAATVWPFQPAELSWRYGAVGLLSGFTLTPLLGGLVLSTTAGLAGHRAALRAVAVLHLAVALALLLLLIGFSLDVLQVRRDTAPDARLVTEVSSAKAAIKLGLTMAAALWLGVGGIRASRVTKG